MANPYVGAMGGAKKTVVVVTGGGGGSGGFTDSFSLTMTLADSNAVPTDSAAFNITLTQADSNAEPGNETLQLQFPAPDFQDTSSAPADTNAFTMRIWLTGNAASADRGGASDAVTSAANANGANDGTIATIQTAVAGNARCVMKAWAAGPGVPSGASVTSAIYRGWFRSVNTLVTSTGIIELAAISGGFSNRNIFSNAALNTTVDHLGGTFTYDLIANGINTLAKIQEIAVYHRTTDAASGVAPHVLTVDAGCIELAGAFV